MKMLEIAKCLADERMSAFEFLPIARRALDTQDDKMSHLAFHGIACKCRTHFSIDDWHSLVTRIGQLFPDDLLILNVATASRLFWGSEIADRDRQRRDCTCWLIRNFPQSVCHEQPDVFDLSDDFFMDGAFAWDDMVSRYPKDPAVLRNAASYFFRRDKDKSAQLYGIGASIDHENTFWVERLAALRRHHAKFNK